LSTATDGGRRGQIDAGAERPRGDGDG